MLMCNWSLLFATVYMYHLELTSEMYLFIFFLRRCFESNRLIFFYLLLYWYTRLVWLIDECCSALLQVMHSMHWGLHWMQQQISSQIGTQIKSIHVLGPMLYVGETVWSLCKIDLNVLFSIVFSSMLLYSTFTCHYKVSKSGFYLYCV